LYCAYEKVKGEEQNKRERGRRYRTQENGGGRVKKSNGEEEIKRMKAGK
jgi:hypothetical protein